MKYRNYSRRNYSRSSTSDTIGGFVGIGCWLAVIAFNLGLGSWSVNYLLLTFMDKTIALGYSILLGLFLGEFTVPIAFVVYILKLAGIL